MAFPRLIVLAPAPAVVLLPAGQLDPVGAAVPVMSLFRQAKLIPRFLLTWAAATHCPRFLKPEQDCCADCPVREAILSESFAFWVRSWSIVLPWTASVLPAPLLAPFALALAWVTPPMALPNPDPWPCCANAGAQYNVTATANAITCMFFIRICPPGRSCLLLITAVQLP